MAAEERLRADDVMDVVVVTRDADLRWRASEHGAASAHPDELRARLHRRATRCRAPRAPPRRDTERMG